MLTRRLRDGQVINMSYDQLNRMVTKDLPGNDPDVTYGYDLLGELTSASQAGHSLSFTYDALGRQLTQTSPRGTITSAYDIAGRRTRITHPDQFFVDQDYLVTGEMTRIRENGATNGVGVLATFAYDNLGRRTSLTRGNGTVTSYGYDAASRLTQLTQDTNGSSNDLTLTFGYNPAAQIASNTRTNDAFSFTAESNTSRIDTHNGLNQVLTTGGTPVAHDARGNTTTIGSATFVYDSHNRMTSAGNVAFGYDPLGRLNYSTGDPHFTTFGYDGMNLVAERDYDGNILRRYVHGPGVDEPLVAYEGSGTSQRRFLHADERGSIIARSDDSGNVTAINRYDEYGVPATTNVGRLQYTGQMWMPEIGMYHFRARVYNPGPAAGPRFMQSDPIGYDDGPNLYAYVGGDPVNRTDPTGTKTINDDVYNGVTYLKRERHPEPRGGAGLTGLTSLWFGGLSGLLDFPVPNILDELGRQRRQWCEAAAQTNSAYSRLGNASPLRTPAFNTPSELALMRQYFRGDNTPYRMSASEFRRAQAYVARYPDAVDQSSSQSAGRFTLKSVHFGLYPEPALDGLLGSATGLFDQSGGLAGIRDTFDFNLEERSGGGYGSNLINAGMLRVRIDAFFCHGNTQIPITGGAG